MIHRDMNEEDRVSGRISRRVAVRRLRRSPANHLSPIVSGVMDTPPTLQ
jgi:hypothetical protein